MMNAENAELEKNTPLTNSENELLAAESAVAAQVEQSGEDVLIDDTLALQKNSEKDKPESIEQVRERLHSEGKKLVAVGDVSAAEKAALTELLVNLLDLQREVDVKRGAALEQSEKIKAKVDGLVTSGKVQIDENEYKRSAVSVAQYASLLENIMAEIQREMQFFALFVQEQVPGYVVAWHTEPDDFATYLKEKVRYIKKYIKNIRKDLNVSFSRYVIGFQAQIDRILHVEAYIRYQERAAQQIAAQAATAK